MNFVEVFNQNYSYFLYEINYRVVTIGNIQDTVNLRIVDDVDFTMLDDSHLRIVVKRQIKFDPNIVYELSVSFGAILEIKDTKTIANDINWHEEFKTSSEGNMVIQGLLSRVSLQIAQITSSYGANPIVTPPNLMT